MIRFEGIALAYGSQVLFNGVSGHLGARERVGLVGLNGTGKSTLLRILTGAISPDAGEIEQARDASIGFLSQEATIDVERPIVEEVEGGDARLRAISLDLARAHETLEKDAPASPAYREGLEKIGQLEANWETLGGYALRARAESILEGLGFATEDLRRPGKEFSGGWRMRVALARLLLANPAYLFLDEPTNHLDMDSIRWLERFLRDYEGSVVLVSHDRAFLDSLCQRILHLERGRLESYTGNYTAFAHERHNRKAILERTAANQARAIERTQRFVDRFRYQANKARLVQSRIKALEKVERIELEPDDETFSFAFPEPARGGADVLKIEGLSHRYGEQTVLHDINLQLERGDRVALVGVNGAGKSTLCRIAAGQMAPTAGTSTLGYEIALGYFAQEQADILDPALTVLEAVEAVSPPNYPIPARTLLGAFLFSGDDVFKRIRVLSGGERNRLALARMLVQPANFLILDEPTNHLDMRAKEVLQQALLGYSGTLLVVSHDRAFLDPLVDRVLEVGHGRVRTHHGTLSEYLAAKEAEEAAAKSNDRAVHRDETNSGDRSRRKRRDRAERRKLLAPLRQEVAAHERTIAELESRIADMETKMQDPAFFRSGQDTKSAVEAHLAAKHKLDQVLLQWETALGKIEAIEAEEETD
jgi:ATP-binding cassette subfamily F protein 3